MPLLTLQFLPDTNKCFFICLVPYPYLHLLFSQFVVLFDFLFPTLLATRHILQFTMYDSISLQLARDITEIKNALQSMTKEKVSR